MLHDLLKDARLKKGLSIDDVAAELNVTPEQIARWESGSEVPTSQQIASLTVIYELPLKVLIGALKETETALIEKRPGVHAVPKAGRIMAAIMMQCFFLMSASMRFEFADPSITFYYRLFTIYLPAMAATFWMISNHRLEQNPTLRQRIAKIELIYCVFQLSVATLGYMFNFPFLAACIISFSCIHYIHSTNEKHMNRPLLNRY